MMCFLKNCKTNVNVHEIGVNLTFVLLLSVLLLTILVLMAIICYTSCKKLDKIYEKLGHERAQTDSVLIDFIRKTESRILKTNYTVEISDKDADGKKYAVTVKKDNQ